MLIYLDCEVSELAKCDMDKRDAALRNLLRAHRLGDHLVVIPRVPCRYLVQEADLCGSDRAMLERIAHEYTQRADLVRKAPRYIRVANRSNEPTSDGRSISVTFDDLAYSRILERSVLLVENIRRDGLLYGELIKAHYDLHDCPVPAYEPMHGGGADLSAVFVEQIRRKRIVCGIVDSDRYSPDSGSAPKLEALRRLGDQLAWPFAFAISPPCREAENCVPMELMMSLQCGKSNTAKHQYLKIADHEKQQQYDCKRSFWLFVDLKQGLSEKTVHKFTDARDKAWVSEKLGILGLELTTVSIHGFGDRVFDQIAANGQHFAQLRSLTRSNTWQEVFFDFVDFLLWIFAGGRRVVT